MPAEGADGADVVESIERIEPNGLFAIRTRPRRRSPAPAKTVLFFVAGHESHVGPTREWVALSRRIAANGSQALRWDPAREGLSGQIRRDPWRRVYSKAEVTDSMAVARHACQGAGELEVVGVCSGSWYAAQVARNMGAQSAILVNLVAWNWRVIPTWLSQWSFRKQTLQSIHPDAASVTSGGPSKSRTARLKALLNQAREPAMIFIHNPPAIRRAGVELGRTRVVAGGGSDNARPP